MSPEKHALFATLTTTSRTEIHALAVNNGLGYDDVVQALLGRTSDRGEGHRLMAEKLHGDADAALLEDVAKLADAWPQPEQVTPLDEDTHRAVFVSGGTLKDGAEQIIKDALANGKTASELAQALNAFLSEGARVEIKSLRTVEAPPST